MTSDHNHTTNSNAEPDNASLRSVLRTRADLLTIAPPPIPTVRRNARKRRTRRRMVQGMSGLAVTCAVVAGVIAWSPGQDAGIGPSPTNTDRPSPTRTAAPPSHRPTQTTTSTPSPTTPTSTPSRTTSGSGFLLASDLGAGWTGPDTTAAPPRPELEVAGSACSTAGGYQPSVPLTPAPNTLFRYSAPGKQPNSLFEAVYVFAPGTGPTVMAKVRATLKTGCGLPAYIKLLASPQTVADEAIVYTAGENTRNILVRSGDRVATLAITTVPAGQAGTDLLTTIAQQMATRLMAG